MILLVKNTLCHSIGRLRICAGAFSLIFVVCFCPSPSQATDPELEERLKAIMILFEKSEIELQEEVLSLKLQIKSLRERNDQLQKQLAFERSKNRRVEAKTAELPTNHPAFLVDINSAPKDSLLTLPLMNGYVADQIISGRPWKQVEDLVQIQGFSPMRLKRLQNLVQAIPVGEITEVAASENPVD